MEFLKLCVSEGAKYPSEILGSGFKSRFIEASFQSVSVPREMVFEWRRDYRRRDVSCTGGPDGDRGALGEARLAHELDGVE
jgi:hypothetical protein